MADRVFIFHETDDRFRAFDFAGAAQTSENWNPSLTTIGGAAANYTHIYVLDTSGSTAIARRFALDQTRQATGDITMNSADTYSGIALTPTHLVAINQTDNKLEYYDLETRAYDSTKDVTLPSTNTSRFDAICQADDHLFIVRGGSEGTDKKIYKRTLSGAAVSDWALPSATNHNTIYATRNRVVAHRKGSGDGDRYQFDGTADSVLASVGSGVWAASYTTFDLATVAFSTPVKLANGNFQFNATWTGGHTGFAQDDLSVNLGTIANFLQTPTPNVFQIEVTPPSTGMGSIELTVREDAVTEKNAKTTFTVGTFDNTPPPPVVTPANLNLSFPVSVLDHGETRTLTITSDKNVTLEAADVTQTGGATLANFAGSNASYTVEVTAPATGSGNIVISIAEDAVPEMNNEVSLTIPYREIQAPTLSSTLTELIDGATTDVLITFPSIVTTFGAGKISVDQGATLSNFTVVTAGRVFRVTATPPASGKGDITLTIAADAVPERNAAASLTIAYSYPATFTFSAPRAVMAHGETQTVTIDADQVVTEFVESDVTIAGGTFTNFTKVSNSQYTVDVTAPATGAGHIVLSIAEDVVPEDNAAATFTIAYQDILPPPTAPTDVSVDLKPTTALLTWNSGGGDIEAYEVNVSEGATLGTTWIPTGSTRTRHLVKHLKRGTQYTFAVRGVNDAGEGPASSSVTERTPIASLHNALFFKTCVNYLDDGARISEHGNLSNIIRAVADNDYRTFATETDYDINIAVNGDPTRVDAVFVKGIGIEGHSAVPTGGSGVGYSNRRMPATVKNWEGTDVSTIVNGFQHDLYLLDAHFTATSVRLTFTGTDVKIVEVMLLEFGIEIDANGDFTEINPDFVDRSGEIHSAPGGSLGYGSPIGAARDKWEVDYAVKVVPGKTLLETPEEFLYWRAENRNHVHAMEPSRFPWRIFPATFVGERVPVRYRTDDKTGGEILTFSVSEQ